jgi:hypothetical protein
MKRWAEIDVFELDDVLPGVLLPRGVAWCEEDSTGGNGGDGREDEAVGRI